MADMPAILEIASKYRLPVIEDHQLVGMISESDLARHLDGPQLAQFATAVYSAPPNS